MASSITIDLSNIGEKVAAAIQESMEKIVREQVAAATKDIQQNKSDEADIAGMRQQILANATILFPILIHDRNGAEESNTKFEIITFGEGTTIAAQVTYRANYERNWRVMMRGEHAESHEQALVKLLKLTSALLNDHAGKLSLEPLEYRNKKVQCQGVSFYYTK